MGSKFDFRMSRSDYDDLCFDLTDDEHAVLDLRRRGMHNADIAAELYCSERTVNRRVRSIKNKVIESPPFVIHSITNGGLYCFYCFDTYTIALRIAVDIEMFFPDCFDIVLTMFCNTAYSSKCKAMSILFL